MKPRIIGDYIFLNLIFRIGLSYNLLVQILLMNMNFKGIKMLDIDTPEFDKKHIIMREYFPYVNFTNFFDDDYSSDGIYLDLDFEILSNYIIEINSEFYLDIPKIARNKLFMSLFPGDNQVEKYKYELNKMKDSGKRPDIVSFFLDKESKNFSKELNTYLAAEYSIDDKYLIESFSDEYLLSKKWCNYEHGETKRKGKFVWEFSDFNEDGSHFFHSGSIYRFFRCYSHKKCTLYLFGVNFIEFIKNPKKWPLIQEIRKKLPEYFSISGDVSKGLIKKIYELNAGDFIWKKNNKWNITESKEYLFKKFGLGSNINANLQEIYYSFCLPLLYEKYCLKETDKDKYIECGYDIIKSTLLKDRNKSGGQIQHYPDAWEEKINHILEGTFKDEDKIVISYFTPFDKFIEQVAGQTWFLKNGIKNNRQKKEKS